MQRECRDELIWKYVERACNAAKSGVSYNTVLCISHFKSKLRQSYLEGQ